MPQQKLRLDAAVPDPDARWRAGGQIVYLGRPLALRLDTDRRAPERVDDELHLPLPPEATARQIRDAAESWLRDEAMTLLRGLAALGREETRVSLRFGRRGDWVRREGGCLRCHWRLVEQPLPVIAQVIARALDRDAPRRCDDLFAPAA
ncbi:MAG: DUF45 domain-containing protein [Sulfuritalea sp.]|nr:DUF45 domain-containing protein [Sulfuritalea sp.]